MDPATFALITAGMQIGANALIAYNNARESGKVTPEQQEEIKVLLERISQAQAMVTPYVKEPGN